MSKFLYIKVSDSVMLSKHQSGDIWYTDEKNGRVRSMKSKFPKLYEKYISKGHKPVEVEYEDDFQKQLESTYKSMQTTQTEATMPETDMSTVNNEMPHQDETPFPQTRSNGTREFVVDVKGLDIRKEIHAATVDFVKLHADANLDKIMDRIIAEKVKALTPNFIKIGERKQVKIEGRTHKAFQECLFLCEQHRQVFISGPAGTGKTTLGEQVAKALSLSFAFISCSAGMSEAHLLGRMLFDGTYVPSDFVTLYENGGVFLMDEVDAADANTLLIINSALANGIISIPNRKEKSHAKRHKDFIVVASANTWGAGSFEYHGRNHLDAAFLDRFAMSKLSVDYDKKIEKEFCQACPELANNLWDIRKNAEKNKVRRIVSTRAFKEGATQIAAGKTIDQVLNRFFVGWTKEEITKVYTKTLQPEFTDAD